MISGIRRPTRTARRFLIALRSPLNVNADDIDNRIISGDLDVAVTALGVQPAAQSRVLTDPTLKENADNPLGVRLWYTSINPTVPPLNNIECRKAVEYAMDHTSYQTAYGGQFAGGDLATTILPPSIPGYSKFDLFPDGPDHKGDLDAAKKSLEACGQPNGFETNIAYRAERPKEKATAEAFQQALGRVGIKLTLKPYPQGDYFAQYAGLPPYVVKNKLGLALNGWAADWPDGFGFLSQIVDSRVIRATGGSSNTSVRIPEVDKMLDSALTELNTDKRNQMWGEIDKRVMQERRHLSRYLLQEPARAVEEWHQHLRNRRIWRVRLSRDGSAEVAHDHLRPEPVEGAPRQAQGA